MRGTKGSGSQDSSEGAARDSPRLTVDGVLVEDGKLLVVVRRNDPFRGWPALPGGFIELGETIADALRREVREETGLDVVLGSLVGVYSEPGRDPRGHIVSIAYEVARRGRIEPTAGSDAAGVSWVPVSPIPGLAFDHARILSDFLNRRR